MDDTASYFNIEYFEKIVIGKANPLQFGWKIKKLVSKIVSILPDKNKNLKFI